MRVNAPIGMAQGIKEDLAMFLERYNDAFVVGVDIVPERDMEQMKIGEEPKKKSVCRYCGAELKWIVTKKGKLMPCNAQPVPYWISEGGKSSLMTEKGELVRCSLQGQGKESGIGYRPHFNDCTGAGRRDNG